MAMYVVDILASKQYYIKMSLVDLCNITVYEAVLGGRESEDFFREILILQSWRTRSTKDILWRGSIIKQGALSSCFMFI